MLKKIYVDCVRHYINDKEFREFRHKMGLAGISAYLGAPGPDAKGVLHITDRVTGTAQSAVAGYGVDYAGGASYVLTSLSGVSPQYCRMIYARYRREPLEIAGTDRLVIREMALSDLDALCALYDTLSDCPYVEPLYDREKEKAYMAAYIQNMYGFYQYGLWLVFERSTRMLVGRIGIENREIDGCCCQELGYLIGKPWQRRGYAEEACRAVLAYGFKELDLEKIFACVQHTNSPSVRLAEKLGFRFYAARTDGLDIYYKSKA